MFQQQTRGEVDRRPIKLRSAKWSIVMARLLVRKGVTPNQVSVMSAVFAAVGALLLLLSTRLPGLGPILSFIGVALCIQLRLLCNLQDGLMAVECNKKSAHGDLFNELPDRISDVLLLVAAGYAAQSGELGVTFGWLAAVLAVTTAYLRAFGARYSKAQDYSGPMAKPERMFMLTVGSLLTAVQYGCTAQTNMILVVLMIICLGAAITCVNRTVHIARAMGSEPC
jgi:phosphatidylglycerophosphate synthase